MIHFKLGRGCNDERCVATSPITCNFIECIAALLIKESLVLSGWKVTQVSNRICR